MADIPSYLAPNSEQQVPQQVQNPAAPLNPSAPSTDLSGGGPAEQVLDVEHGTPLNIPHSEFEIAVRSGQYAPVADKEYVVKDPMGQTHRVKGTNLKQVFDEGSTFAAPEEAHAHIVQSKYGNSEGLAALEGLQRGFLPGVSDRLLEGSKTFDGGTITQEDLAGRAEANPISAGIGEAIGTVASPLGKLAMGVGGKAASSLAKVGVKAGLSNKVAQAIVSKVIPAAAGSAVEGAYFGAAHLINEDALGTAQFNAENLLSSVEQGALWGAAFGGGLSALGSATSSTAKAMAESKAGRYLSDKADEIGAYVNNKNKAVYEFLGITPAKAQKLAKNDKEFIDDALTWTKEILEENPRAGVAEVAAKAKSDLDTVGVKIGNLYDDVDKTLAGKKLPPHTNLGSLKMKIAEKLDEEILPKLDGVLGTAADMKMVNREINAIFEDAVKSEGATIGAKELHEMLRKVDDVLYKDKQLSMGALTLKQQMLKVQRELIREELNNAVATSAKAFPAELGAAAETLKQLNRRYRTITSLKDAVEKRAFGEANSSLFKGVADLTTVGAAAIDPTLGAATVVAKKFLESDMLRKMQILGKIEKAQLKTRSAIQGGLKLLASGTAATEPLVAQSLVSSAIATELVEGKKTKPKDEQQAYRNIANNARFAAENPEQFLQGVNRYSSHLYAVAPKTSGALDSAALNAMVFLHSKAKKSTKQKGFFDAGKPDKVNGAEMLKMQQRIDMIQTPSKAFKLLGKGKLGATHVETIKAVYPALYSEMQKETMNFLSSEKAANLTYSQKLNMASLLDIQADESMHYSNVMALQENFETSSEDGMGGQSNSGLVNPTQSGLAKVNKASRMDSDDTNDDIA